MRPKNVVTIDCIQFCYIWAFTSEDTAVMGTASDLIDALFKNPIFISEPIGTLGKWSNEAIYNYTTCRENRMTGLGGIDFLENDRVISLAQLIGQISVCVLLTVFAAHPFSL